MTRANNMFYLLAGTEIDELHWCQRCRGIFGSNLSSLSWSCCQHDLQSPFLPTRIRIRPTSEPDTDHYQSLGLAHLQGVPKEVCPVYVADVEEQ